MAERLNFVLTGSDRLSPALDHAARSADHLSDELRLSNGRLSDLHDGVDASGGRLSRFSGEVDSGAGSLTEFAASGGRAASSLGTSGGGLGAALGATAGVLGLTLLPAIGAAVPALAGMALAAGTLKLGFSGISDAVALAGKDQKAYADALKKMPSEARTFTRELVKIQDGFKDTGDQIKKVMLPGFTKALKDAEPILKIVSDSMVGLGEGFGKVAEGAGKLFGDGSFQKDLKTNLDLGQQFVLGLAPGLADLTKSILDFGAASKPTLDAFGRGIGDLLSKGIPGFFDGLQQGIPGAAAALDGLFSAVNDILPALGRFAGEVAKALGPILGPTFTIAGKATAGVLDLITGAVKLLSPELRDMGFALKTVVDIGKIIGPTLGDMVSVLVDGLLPSVGRVGDAAGPFEKLNRAINDNKLILLEITRVGANVFLDLADIAVHTVPVIVGMFRDMTDSILFNIGGIVKGAAAAFDWVPGVGDKLKVADKAFSDFRDGFVGKLDDAAKKTQQFADEVTPRLEAGRLRLNISNWEAQIAEAKRLLSDENLPAEKRGRLLQNIKDWQAKVDAAKRQAQGAADRIYIGKLRGDKSDWDAKTSAVFRTKIPSKVGRITGDKSPFQAVVNAISGSVVGTAYINVAARKVGSTIAGLTPFRADGGLISGYAGGGRIRGYPSGGLLSGPGTGTSDSILARVSNGEYVIRAAAVRKYGAQLFEQLNAMRVEASSMAARPVPVARPATVAAGEQPFIGSLVVQASPNASADDIISSAMFQARVARRRGVHT